MRGLLLLGLLLLSPLAVAQPPVFPNVTDGAGDQTPPGAATGWADLLRGWMAPDEQGLAFTLEVASLAATDPAQYEVVWFTPRGETVVGMGLGATLEAGQVRAYRIETTPRDGCMTRQQPLASAGAATATIQTGTPGKIIWKIKPADIGAQRDETFYSFCAFTYFRSPLVAAFNADAARTPQNQILNQSFQVGLNEAVKVADFDLHEDHTFLDDEKSPPTPAVGAYDIDAVQFYAGPDTVDTTVRLRGFNWSDLSAKQWHMNVGISRYNPYGESGLAESLSANLFVRNDTLRYASVTRSMRQADNETSMPATLQVRLGAPGYVRFSVPRDNWTLPTDLGGLRIFVFLGSFQHNERPDNFYIAPESFFDMPVPWTLVLVALLAAAWVRHRHR